MTFEVGLFACNWAAVGEKAGSVVVVVVVVVAV